MGSDDFNRANNADISASAPITWTQAETPDGNVLRVIDNALRCLCAISGASIYGGYATDDSVTSNNQSAQLEFVDITAAGTSGVGVRMSGAVNTFIGYVALYNGTNIRLMRYDTQDLRDTSVPGTVLATVTDTLAATDTLYLQIVGTQLVMRKNAAVIATVSDATIATGGAGVVSHGLANTDTRVANWDNWVGANDPVALSTWNAMLMPAATSFAGGRAHGIGTGT